jgi:hypothetical protein
LDGRYGAVCRVDHVVAGWSAGVKRSYLGVHFERKESFLYVYIYLVEIKEKMEEK